MTMAAVATATPAIDMAAMIFTALCDFFEKRYRRAILNVNNDGLCFVGGDCQGLFLQQMVDVFDIVERVV